MTKKKRRSFAPEFKADAVQLCATGERTVAQVAVDLGLTESALRSWVKTAEANAAPASASALTTAERSELADLRRRVKRLQMEREILKKAAAFFAKESA